MLEPLLKNEKNVGIISARLVIFIFALGCVGIISAKFLFLQAEQKAAPMKLEKVVGVWTDMQVKSCVSVKDTCIGKWITENHELWKDAIEPDESLFSPRPGGSVPPKPAGVEGAVSGSQRKLLAEVTDNSETQYVDIVEPSQSVPLQLGNLGGFSDENANLEFLKFFGDTGGLKFTDSEPNSAPGDNTDFPGERRVPYICRDYNIFPANINCSPDEARWVKAAERRLGAGGFGAAYVGQYNMAAAENSILSPHYVQGKEVVQKRANNKVSQGELVLEAILMLAVQTRVPDVAVRAVDVYDRWAIVQPVCEGDIGKLRAAFRGNIPAVMYLLSEVYGKLDAMHKQAGLVHRDIKPPNLLYLVKPFRILLGDIGSALPLDGKSPSTMPLNAIGMTKDYWAPEYGAGSMVDPPTVDYRTCDLWSATFSAFELYYGVKLWSKKWDQADFEWSAMLSTYYEKGNLDNVLQNSLSAEQLKDPLTGFFQQTLQPKEGGRNDAQKLRTLALQFYNDHKGEFDLETFPVPPSPRKAPAQVKKATPKTPKKPSTPSQSTKSKKGRASDSLE